GCFSFCRSLSQDRSGLSSWTDILSHPQKHKELANYCSLLQEHYHQSYVRGVYRSLQQACSISSPDILLAMDYCEESLQEIDITAFLQTLCGHIRGFKERSRTQRPGGGPQLRRMPSFSIGPVDEMPTKTSTGVANSCSSSEVEDSSEGESKGKASQQNQDDPKLPAFPLSLLQTEPRCDVYPDLHKIIQEKFLRILSQHFKSVPSNPHYYFYCPLSAQKEVDSEDGGHERTPSEEPTSDAEPTSEEENACGSCLLESDPDLEVAYEEQAGTSSQSDSNTVNQDQDSFSILDGESLLEAEVLVPDLPPLFLHVTCSVNMNGGHGSTPTRTLPTCLGESPRPHL
ncbi:PREDICTED: protein SZT2-like, partial [Cyprinodon variegatus]|uniref:protein SZT2-like n=1 Tax=Cyprinodon variegatus TaxID=28743 RepID=UPI000742954A